MLCHSRIDNNDVLSASSVVESVVIESDAAAPGVQNLVYPPSITNCSPVV